MNFTNASSSRRCKPGQSDLWWMRPTFAALDISSRRAIHAWETVEFSQSNFASAAFLGSLPLV